jgi:hypothetical protein
VGVDLRYGGIRKERLISDPIVPCFVKTLSDLDMMAFSVPLIP